METEPVEVDENSMSIENNFLFQSAENQETAIKTPVSLNELSPNRPVESMGPSTSSSGNTLSLNVNFDSIGEEPSGAMATVPRGTL
jgi:hypothetical protein